MPSCRTVIAAAAAALLASPAAASPPDFSRLAGSALGGVSAPATMAAARSMVAIPAGTYPIGRDDAAADQRPRHTVTLGAFRIDRTEVTNAAFAEYLNALGLSMRGSFGIGGMSARNGSGEAARLLMEGDEGSGRYPIIALDDEQARIVLVDGRFMAAPGYADHPVAETTWAGARAYCLWRGADLPSEVEWEAAARGTDNRRYPWGDAAPSAATAFLSGRSGVTGAVGERPAGASPFGALDMAGGMAEWTLSLKRPYPYAAGDGRETPGRAGERVTRGGDYRYDRTPATLTVSHRNGFSNAPERGHRHIGFRCAAR
jgi:formylglycine-generating enzyme required for sulfatase activity